MTKPVGNKKNNLVFIFDIYFFKKYKKNLRGIFGELVCDPKWSNNIFTLKYIE